MKNLIRLLAVVMLLLAFTSIISAEDSYPKPEPFATFGYTTNLFHVPPSTGLPPLLPTEFQPLPSSHVKFHISAQGGSLVDDDALCMSFYGDTCQNVCKRYTNMPCGTVGAFMNGSFNFEEWGLYYPAPVFTPQGKIAIGANNGDLAITTEQGEAAFIFGGQAFYNPRKGNNTVAGSYSALGGTGAYAGSLADGTYRGGADFVFGVKYIPCRNGLCPATSCQVYGNDVTISDNTVSWTIDNSGVSPLTIDVITINWVDVGNTLQTVSLDSEIIFEGAIAEEPVPPLPDFVGRYATVIDWEGDDAQRQIPAQQTAVVTFGFANPTTGGAADYSILVQFAEGCAVSFVAFDPASTADTLNLLGEEPAKFDAMRFSAPSK